MTRLLRLNEVEQIVGFKKSTIYSWINRGVFPRPVRPSRRSVRWKQDDIAKWIESLTLLLCSQLIDPRRIMTTSRIAPSEHRRHYQEAA